MHDGSIGGCGKEFGVRSGNDVDGGDVDGGDVDGGDVEGGDVDGGNVDGGMFVSCPED